MSTALFDFSNKTALIIGASSGLGKQAAHALSAAGARVIVASNKMAELEQAAQSLNNARAIFVDIADKSSVKTLFETVESEQERIDVLVCTAGVSGLVPIFGTEDNDLFEKQIQTNLIGTWYIVKQAANHMKHHNIQGSLITFASVCGTTMTYPGIAAYGASKAGMIHMTRILANELAPAGIRINCIAPGLFHTELTNYKLSTPELKQIMNKTIPLGFVGEPSDIEGTVLYLASNAAARYVTGSCLTIDGGESWGRYVAAQAPGNPHQAE